MRNTKQKQIINSVIEQLFHFTSDDLISKVSEIDSTIGRATVFRYLNELIEQNSEAINKLNDIIGYLVNNKEKNNEKVIFSLFNTEKENYINLINNFNLLNKKINLIK